MRKIFSKLNIPKNLISKGTSLIVVFSVLVAAYAAISLNVTLGWFAENDSVSANGMNAQAYKADFEVSFNDGKGHTDLGTIISENLQVPGDSVTFTITVKNIGEHSVDMTAMGLEAPTDAQEKPKVVGDTNYYLSSVLTVRTESVTVDDGTEKDVKDVTEAAAMPLRDSTNGAGRIDFFSWINFGDGEKVITLESGKSMTVSVTITFVDSGKPQNEYKNFADEGTCARELFFTYND